MSPGIEIPERGDRSVQSFTRLLIDLELSLRSAGLQA